jgi:hypothetical protein
MIIADVHSYLRHRDVVILLMVNDCNDVDLLACGLLAYHIGDLKVGQG